MFAFLLQFVSPAGAGWGRPIRSPLSDRGEAGQARERGEGRSRGPHSDRHWTGRGLERATVMPTGRSRSHEERARCRRSGRPIRHMPVI